MNITGQPDTATPTTDTRRGLPTQAASIPAIVRGTEIAMLDGTTDKQDARLLADINAAPDPFDGGCPADVEPAKPINHKDDFMDYLRDKMHQRERMGIQTGLSRAAQICLDADHLEAADLIIRAMGKD